MSRTIVETWRDLRANIRGYPATAFWVCLIGVSLENMDQAFFSFVLPQISKELGWTVEERGWYIALTFTIAGLCIAGLGSLTDRVGRKTVFSTSMVVGSLFVTAMYWAHTTFSMVALRTLGFATGGIQSPVVGTIVVEETPSRYRGLMSGILQIGYPIGWFLASQFVLFMSDRWGWRSVFFVALLSVPYMFVIQRRLRETGAFLRAREAADRGEATGARGRFSELFAPDMAYRSIILFLGEYFHVFAYGSTILLTAYFQEFRSFSMRDAVSLVGWSYGVGALGYIVAAIVGEFFISRRTTCIVWAWLGSAAFFVMIWWAEAYWTTVLFYCLMTIFFYGTTAVKFTFIAENFPARLRATGVTFSGSLAVNLGIATGPLALSYAVAYFDGDWNKAYTLCGILPIFISGAFFLLMPKVPLGIEEDRSAGIIS
jgi:MFS transporter, putative metabolite:H+ symporter